MPYYEVAGTQYFSMSLKRIDIIVRNKECNNETAVFMNIEATEHKIKKAISIFT